MTSSLLSTSKKRPSFSYLKFQGGALRDTVTVKHLVCWGVALSFYVLELYAHTQCWEETFLYPHTVNCVQLMLGHRYAVMLTITEAACCAGLSVAFVSALWDIPSSIQEHGLRGYFSGFFGGWAELVGIVYVVFTMSMGIWLLVAAPPHVVAYYFHLFEIACAVMVINGLVGVVCDLVVAAYSSKTLKFMIQVAVCDDNQFEGNGEWDSSLRKSSSNKDVSVEVIIRACVLWVVFALAFFMVIHRSSGGSVHSAVDVYFGSLAIVCSGHISAMVARNCRFLCSDGREQVDETAPLRAV